MISKIGVGNIAIQNSKISNNKKNEEIQREIKNKNSDRLESIKKSIKNGEYQIDISKTAQKVADALLWSLIFSFFAKNQEEQNNDILLYKRCY